MTNQLPETDLKLIFALGKPLNIDRLTIYPVTIEEIADFGYSKFLHWIPFLCIDKDTLLNINPDFPEQFSAYDFLIAQVENDENPEFKANILDLLNLILKQDMKYNSVYKNFTPCNPDEKIVLDEKNHGEFSKYVLMRNKFIEDDVCETKATKKAQELKKRIAEKQKKIQKSENNEEVLLISDLVYVLSIGMHSPSSALMKFDIYQLYECLTRLRIFKDYELNTQALLHGAGKDSIDITHWMGKPPKDV